MKKTLLAARRSPRRCSARAAAAATMRRRRRRRPRGAGEREPVASTASSPTCKSLVASMADMLEPVDTSAVAPPTDDDGRADQTVD